MKKWVSEIQVHSSEFGLGFDDAFDKVDKLGFEYSSKDWSSDTAEHPRSQQELESAVVL